MKVCIVYEMNNREYNNSILLKRELIKRGHEVKVCNKTEDLNLFKYYDVTLIPNSYNNGDLNYYRYVFNVRQKCQCVLVMYPCEQAINRILSGVFDLSQENKVKKLPHFCWGKDYYDWIQELGYRNDETRITGAIQLDFCRKEFRTLYLTKEELSVKYGLPLGKKWIMFISDFVYTNDKRLLHSLKAGDVDGGDIYDRKQFEEESLDAIIKWFEKFIADHEDYIVIYRKHPTEIITGKLESISEKNNGKFFLISDLSIKEWLFNCDIITTWNSTSVVECFVAGIKIGLLRPFEFPETQKKYESSLLTSFDRIRTYDQFEECMKKGLYEFNDWFKNEVNYLYDISDNIPAYERLADAIESVRYHGEFDDEKTSFQISRLSFLLKNHVIIKVIAKKCFQLFYRITRFSPPFLGKMRMAMVEWVLSAENKRGRVKLEKKIDEIINR